jgi:hypothetical protein
VVLRITGRVYEELSFIGPKRCYVDCREGLTKYTYVGEFELGAYERPVLTGNGKLFLRGSKELRYEGALVGGAREGRGKSYHQNGKLWYIGNWKNNRREGKGREYYLDGKSWYDGDWKNDMENGWGYSTHQMELNAVVDGKMV